MISTIIIAAILIGILAAIVAAFIYSSKKGTRKKQKGLQDAYTLVINQHALHPEDMEVFDQRILALDGSRKVFVSVQLDPAHAADVIPLAEVEECHVWTDGFRVSGGRTQSQEEQVNAVMLSFVRRSGEVINVPVYSARHDGIFDRMLLTGAAKAWQARINGVLKGRSGKALPA